MSQCDCVVLNDVVVEWTVILGREQSYVAAVFDQWKW